MAAFLGQNDRVINKNSQEIEKEEPKQTLWWLLEATQKNPEKIRLCQSCMLWSCSRT